MSFILGSPRKLQEKQKQPLVPRPGAAQEANILLSSFINMNHPLSLVSGFPRFADRNQDDPLKKLLSAQGSLVELESETSFSGKAAYQIGLENCFWDCLRPDFIRRISKVKDDDDDFLMDTDSNGIIAETAWPVLDWFVKVIEKEESLLNGKCRPAHDLRILTSGSTRARFEDSALPDTCPSHGDWSTVGSWPSFGNNICLLSVVDWAQKSGSGSPLASGM